MNTILKYHLTLEQSNIILKLFFVESTPSKGETVKKEQLTKAQKRRMWQKGGLEEGDRARGWDWVDVIRHLSQTGGKED